MLWLALPLTLGAPKIMQGFFSKPAGAIITIKSCSQLKLPRTTALQISCPLLACYNNYLHAKWQITIVIAEIFALKRKQSFCHIWINCPLGHNVPCVKFRRKSGAVAAAQAHSVPFVSCLKFPCILMSPIMCTCVHLPDSYMNSELLILRGTC